MTKSNDIWHPQHDNWILLLNENANQVSSVFFSFFFKKLFEKFIANENIRKTLKLLARSEWEMKEFCALFSNFNFINYF